ncbi:MAG: hypothetical protein JHC82_14255, partial [Stenotrophomonas sp.]|nr:hypothetical protein [Stenotrophomonas sp.]
VHTHALVVSLRDFIREALDLAPVPTGLEIPHQGPTRPASGGAAKGRADSGERGGKAGGGAGGAGMGAMGGLGAGMAVGTQSTDAPPEAR